MYNRLTINELRNYIIMMYGYNENEVQVVSGIMGVPISYLDKYCPEQFEIVGYMASHGKVPKGIPNEAPYMNGRWLYNRILIKQKRQLVSNN